MSSSRRSSWSSLLPAPATTPSLTLSPGFASPSPNMPAHDILLYDSSSDISFEIEAVVNIVHQAPVPSSDRCFQEKRVKIADRDAYIKAAEMTASMQSTLQRYTEDEIQQKYRVTRSDKIGSMGLYTLVKARQPTRERPSSLMIPSGIGLGSLFTPQSSGRSFMSLITPRTGSLTGTLDTPKEEEGGDSGYFDGSLAASLPEE